MPEGARSVSCPLTPTQCSETPSFLMKLHPATLPKLQSVHASLVESSYGWHTGDVFFMMKHWYPQLFIRGAWHRLVPAFEYGFSQAPNLPWRLCHDQQSRRFTRQMLSAWTGDTVGALLVVFGSTTLLFSMILPVLFFSPGRLLEDSRNPWTYQSDAKSRAEGPCKENKQ